MIMPDITLNPSDAAELTELLQFIRDAITSDHEHLNASLTRFIGHRGYDLAQGRTDLDRFTFLLRGNDGESLFGEPNQ